jgi:hypothetical protein
VRVYGWRTFERLSWRDRWVLGQALTLLPLTAATLRVLSFARLQSVLSSTLPRPSRDTSASYPLDRIHATTQLVRLAANRGPVRVTCLPHSVVLWWLLRRQGVDAVLRFGVRKTAGEIEAHAWVEHGGTALNDDGDIRERFAAFDRAIAR